MNRMKVTYALLRVLVANQSYLSLKKLTKMVSDYIINEYSEFQFELKEKRIKNYLVDLQKEFQYSIETLQGPDGGYRIASEGRESLKELLGLSLSNYERNALNDAFEMAFKAQTYHYNQDLKSAKVKLYDKKDLKDQDFEYYIGVAQYNKDVTNTIKILKDAMVNHYWVRLTFKHNYYQIDKGTSEWIPLYIIHDSDESFLVIKNKEGIHKYQNILNITKIVKMEKKFQLPYNENIKNHMTDKSLLFKKQVELIFTVKTDMGRSIMDLWNYEYEVIVKDGDYYEIKFHEVYKAYEFLYRVQPHIQNLKVEGNYKKEFKKAWNQNLEILKSI